MSSNSGPGFLKTGTGALNLTNCLVFAQSNDAVRITTGTVVIGSCTFANNLGWGISNGVGLVSVINSIAWGNTNGGMTNCTTVSYSDSQNSIGGPGNTSGDPNFTSGSKGDFHLISGSPCINSGSNEAWMAGALDLEGNPRKFGGSVDMGCYESFSGPGTIIILK